MASATENSEQIAANIPAPEEPKEQVVGSNHFTQDALAHAGGNMTKPALIAGGIILTAGIALTIGSTRRSRRTWVCLHHPCGHASAR